MAGIPDASQAQAQSALVDALRVCINSEGDDGRLEVGVAPFDCCCKWCCCPDSCMGKYKDIREDLEHRFDSASVELSGLKLSSQKDPKYAAQYEKIKSGTTGGKEFFGEIKDLYSAILQEWVNSILPFPNTVNAHPGAQGAVAIPIDPTKIWLPPSSACCCKEDYAKYKRRIREKFLNVVVLSDFYDTNIDNVPYLVTLLKKTRLGETLSFQLQLDSVATYVHADQKSMAQTGIVQNFQRNLEDALEWKTLGINGDASIPKQWAREFLLELSNRRGVLPTRDANLYAYLDYSVNFLDPISRIKISDQIWSDVVDHVISEVKTYSILMVASKIRNLRKCGATVPLLILPLLLIGLIVGLVIYLSRQAIG